MTPPPTVEATPPCVPPVELPARSVCRAFYSSARTCRGGRKCDHGPSTRGFTTPPASVVNERGPAFYSHTAVFAPFPAVGVPLTATRPGNDTAAGSAFYSEHGNLRGAVRVSADREAHAINSVPARTRWLLTGFAPRPHSLTNLNNGER